MRRTHPLANVPSHQKHSDGSAGEESRQDVGPVVAVLSHPDHADEQGQAEQGEADGGLGEPRAFGLEHQCHVHLQRGTREGAHSLGATNTGRNTRHTSMYRYNLTRFLKKRCRKQNWLLLLAA